MTTFYARFAISLFLYIVAVRVSSAYARLNVDELGPTHREGCGSQEDREMRRPGSRPGISPDIRHDEMSCKIPERGVEPGDRRMLSEIFDKAISSDSIQWQVFEESIVP